VNLIYRQGKLFKINESLLSKQANKTDIKNALYAAIYDEFKGASENPIYMQLTPLEKMQRLNDYASNWLKDRGLV
jgi:hypothetical protein